MPNELTGGWDAILQISEELLDRLFIRNYFLETFPRKIAGDIEFAGLAGTSAFDIGVPSLSLSFTPDTPQPGAVRLTLPFDGRLTLSKAGDPQLLGTHHVQGTYKADIAIANVETDANDVKHGQVLLDFPNTTATAIDVALNDPDDNSPIHAGLAFLLRYGLLANFQAMEPATIVSLPLGRGPSDIRAVRARTINSTEPGHVSYMAIYFRYFNAQGEPRPAPAHLLRGDDVAIALTESFVQKKIKDGLKESGLDPLPAALPKRKPDDPPTILRALSFALQDGYVDVSGSFTREDAVGVIDLDADFTAKGYFTGPDFALRHKSIDGPWWAYLAAMLDPVVTNILLSNIFIQVLHELNSGNFVGLPSLAKLPLDFAAGQAPTPSAGAYAIDIVRNGLVVHGKVRLRTFIGNENTRELHVFTDKQWLSAMSDNHKVPFERISRALEGGYNGCWYCLREFNTG